MNKVCLTGRFTKDSEVRYSQGENSTAIARNTIAVQRRFRSEGDQQADFINVIAFGNTASFMEKYGVKGAKFDITGRIQTGSYTNKDGQKVYTTEVIVETIEFGETKGGNSGNNNPPSSPDANAFVPDDSDEDLPFN